MATSSAAEAIAGMTEAERYDFDRLGYIHVPGFLTASETELLGRLGLPRVMVGPLLIFASHCIVLVHNHLDLFLPPYFAMKHARKALPPSEGCRLSSSPAPPVETDRWCSIS